MTKQETKLLNALLLKLRQERIDKYLSEGYDLSEMDDDEIYELDDGDNLLQGIDTVLNAI